LRAWALGEKSPRGNSPLGDESLLAGRLTLRTREVAQEIAKEDSRDTLGPIRLVAGRMAKMHFLQAK
jgi:hypothetical protein